MRYDTKRKLSRNTALVKYRDEHPHDSWTEVGDMFGISRQCAKKVYDSTKRREALLNGVQ